MTDLHRAAQVTYDAQMAAEQLLASLPDLRPLLRVVAQNLEIAQAFEERQQKEEAFAVVGICLPPSMPAQLIEEIVRRHKAGKKPVAQLVLGFYRRDQWSQLVTMVDRWKRNRFFRRRMHAFEQALWAHQEGQYTLSVRALTPDVEGLVLDWLFEFSNRDTEFVKSMLKKRGKDSGNGDNSKYDANVVSRTIAQLAANTLTREGWLSMFTLVDFANQFLYRGYKIELEHQKFLRETTLARHPMLHGSVLGSGTALNSLRLFLALDVLSLVE